MVHPATRSTPIGQLRRWLSLGGQAFLDLLFPPRCPGCGRLGVLFCSECQARIQPLEAPLCQRCGLPLERGRLCLACRGIESPLDRIVSTAAYEAPLREAIHALKYKNARALAEPLGQRMVACWAERNLTADVIVPVPLHRRRLIERGYNQSSLLARVLGRDIGIPVLETLVVRQRDTRPQVGLSYEERRQNVAGAFACRGGVAGKRVALVDDVCTTGATLEACAGALRTAGAAGVWAFTLARARWEPGHPAPDISPDDGSQG